MYPTDPFEADDDVRFWRNVVLIFVAAFIAAVVIICLLYPRPSSALGGGPGRTLEQRVEVLSQKAEALSYLYEEDILLAEEYRRLGGIAKIHNPNLTAAEVYEIGRAVHTHSEAAGLTPHLILAVLIVESRGDIYAVSPKGALGLMQVMPWWFAELGIEGDPFVIDTNVEAGVKILSANIERWGFEEGVHRYFWGTKETSSKEYLAKVLKTMEEIKHG